MTQQIMPHFEIEATGPQRFSTAAFKGQKYILYFYPRDDTPGCTVEGTDFRDKHQQFLDAGFMVFGISRDTVKSHEKFKTKMGFTFDLLADPDETVCAIFGVMKNKNMYGKQVRGIERSTFIMGGNNEVLKEWRGVKVPGHVDEVLAAVHSLK
jgi:thioredoxin-dependent peroxiredoxin